MRALEGVVFLLVISSPDVLLLLISSPWVDVYQAKCRSAPDFLLVPLSNIFNSRMHMVTPVLCVIFLLLGTRD